MAPVWLSSQMLLLVVYWKKQYVQLKTTAIKEPINML